MDEYELYWLAGLLEGEGSFLKGPPSRPGMPCISLQMTDVDTVERVADLFGVSYHKIKSRDAKWKDSYVVAVRGFRAVDLMKKLMPLMSKRRTEQICAAISTYKSKYRKGRRFPPREKLVEMHKTMSLREIGRRLGCSHQCILKRIHGAVV